jgi:glyoxylase I family protein
MTPSTSFIHVAYTCKDTDCIERFYSKHFGFKRSRVVQLDNGERIVFIKSENAYIELFQSKEEAPIPPPTNDGYSFPGMRHIAFVVENVDAKLAEMGADARIMLHPASFDKWIRGWRGAWLADPEGNIVELCQGYADEQEPLPL